MSCSLHDVMRLEELGIPTALLVTDAFRRSVAEQAPLLGLGGYDPVWVQHPVAGLRQAAAQAKADAVAPAVACVLLGHGAEPALPTLAANADGLAANADGLAANADGLGAGAEGLGAGAEGLGADCTDVACAIDLSELGR